MVAEFIDGGFLQMNFKVYYRNIEEGYTEAYLLHKYYKAEYQTNNFDMTIFENDEIVIDSKKLTRQEMIQIAIKSKPDFIFDTKYRWQIEKYGWYKSTHGIQAKISNKTTRLARFVIELITNEQKIIKYGLEVTFKNNDYYDYRIDNLIFMNISKARQLRKTKSSSGYRGVFQIGSSYRAVCNTTRIGLFDSAEEAAKAYNEKAIELYGKNAYQNKIKKVKKPKGA